MNNEKQIEDEGHYYIIYIQYSDDCNNACYENVHNDADNTSI